MSEFMVRAPGKIVLFGEHAVVYDKKCIASSLDKYSYAQIKETNKGQTLVIQLPSSSPEYKISQETFHKLLLKLEPKKSFELSIKSEIIIGQGLGSSASFSVCISTLILLIEEIITTLTPQSKILINENALFCENVLHGKASGVDNTISTYGGIHQYTKSQTRKLISQKSCALKFLIIDTKVPKNTAYQVKKFKQLKDKLKSVDLIVEAIDLVADEFRELYEKDLVSEDIGDLVKMNQGLLYAAQMSHEVIDLVVQKGGTLGIQCKLTGAGGGGCCLAYIQGVASDVVQEFREWLELKGMDVFESCLGGSGVAFVKSDLDNGFIDLDFNQLGEFFK
jgi:mevalonate kinase